MKLGQKLKGDELGMVTRPNFGPATPVGAGPIESLPLVNQQFFSKKALRIFSIFFCMRFPYDKGKKHTAVFTKKILIH